MRYRTGETERELRRLAPQEWKAWTRANSEFQDACRSLRNKASKEYDAWSKVSRFKIEGSEFRINHAAESYAIALNKLEKALINAAPEEWTQYKGAMHAVDEAAKALARKVPLEWATFLFGDVY